MKKIKKVLISISLFFIGITTKVLAEADSEISTMYGVPKDQVLYGPPRNDYIDPDRIPGVDPENASVVLNTWNIVAKFFIPFILLIGLIVYFKKSKSSLKKKIIVSIVLILVTLIACLGITYLLNNI